MRSFGREAFPTDAPIASELPYFEFERQFLPDNRWTVPIHRLTYYLDDAGNRNSVNGNGTVTGYTPNILNQYGETGNGSQHEISGYNGVSYVYVADTRLASASSSAAGTYELGYDALGRCVRRTSNGVASYYAYSGEHSILEYDGTGALLSYTLYGNGMDEAIMRSNNGVWQLLFQDRVGSTTALANMSGQIIEQYRYDVFGTPEFRSRPPATGNPRGTLQPLGTLCNNRILFTGREWTAKYGFYEYRARAYHPGLGRFMSEDPMGFSAGDNNLFRYCGNDPMDRTDPTGLIDGILDRSGYLEYQLVQDTKIDYGGDGWHVEGLKGTENKPGDRVHLEVDRTVSTGRGGAPGATTHDTTASTVNGTPTIHEQINVRYASDAGPKNQTFARNNEFTHSNDLIKDANTYRGKAEAFATASNLSPANTLRMLQNGGRSRGSGMFDSVTEFNHRAFYRSAEKWDQTPLKTMIKTGGWKAPNGTYVWPHTPIDPETGYPLNFKD